MPQPYKSILEEIDRYEALAVIKIDRARILNSLGLDIENSRFLNLSNLGIPELNDLLMKSLTWIERVNEVLSTAKKISMDLELEGERIFNEQLRRASSGGDGGSVKVTDAKAAAKTSEEYVVHQRKVNLLSAYVDYLERFSKNLDKMHYAFKGRLDSMRGMEQKHYSL